MAKSKIYQSYEELVAKNKAVFKRFSSSRYQGIFKAIWESRQSEVDRLESHQAYLANRFLERSYQYLEKRKELKEQKKITKKEIQTQGWYRDQLLNTTTNFQKISKKYKSIQNQFQKAAEHIDNLDQVQRLSDDRERNQKKQISHLQDDLTIAKGQIADFFYQMEQMEKDYQQALYQIDQLENTIKKEESYSRQYKGLNQKMNDELMRVNQKLNRFEELF
ncbi:MAG: hypothetical protein HN509_09505 [Halobacteriovoraceae bacterium]|jgi:chromosome segregation ATPase|nr:hypothetical protein [Halobacteriovoraceae bacterium]MBT5094088.1 hypothetical protein [Halobacteriovoraceae bacterium]